MLYIQRLMGMLMSGVWWWGHISNGRHESFRVTGPEAWSSGLGPVWGRVTWEDELLNGAERCLRDSGEAIFKLRPTHWWSGPEIWQGWSKGEEYQRVTWRGQGGQELMESNLQELLDVDLTERPQMQRAAMKTVSQRDFPLALFPPIKSFCS